MQHIIAYKGMDSIIQQRTRVWLKKKVATLVGHTPYPGTREKTQQQYREARQKNLPQDPEFQIGPFGEEVLFVALSAFWPFSVSEERMVREERILSSLTCKSDRHWHRWHLS